MHRPVLSALFVYQFCGLGGVETSVLTKIAALAECGLRARALFLETYGSGAEEIARAPGVLFGLDKDEVAKVLRDVDVVISIDFPDFLDVVTASRSEARVVFESHASYLPALERFYRRLASPSIAAIVVPSEYNRRLVLRFTDRSDDVHVIPNAVDMSRFRPDGEPASHIDAGDPVILWIGRLEDQKNPLDFVRIGVRLLRGGGRFRFVTVGGDPGYDDTATEIRRLIPSEYRASFLYLRRAFPSEMPALYNLARESGGCLISTSLNESQPMIVLEAMASGCPVVSSRVGGIPEIVEAGVTGYLYDLGDDETAARAIIDLADPGRVAARETMTRRALAAVREKHDPTSQARRYRELLEGLS